MIPDHKDVSSKSQFLGFLEALQEDLKQNPEGWENPTLDRYLEALAAWVTVYENCYRNAGKAAPAEPNWTFFAEALTAARLYE